MSNEWKPAGYTSLSPYLIAANAEGVISFLRGALDAIGQAGGDWPPVPCHLHLYVLDVDATYARALEHGGESVQAPTQKAGDADRRGGVEDPGGNTWWFATQVDT